MLKVQSKYKICKRLGSGVFEKCQTQKFMLSEARTQKNRQGKRRRGTVSDYGRQLLEKQKVRYTYGLPEKQLARYADEAHKDHAGPTLALYRTLERRLDNVAYRLGLASTRRLARQMVSHGHITVNGRKMTTPSHQVNVGDVIAIREGSREKALFANLTEQLAEHAMPAWLSFNAQTYSGTLDRLPELTDADPGFDLGAVFEFYSR